MFKDATVLKDVFFHMAILHGCRIMAEFGGTRCIIPLKVIHTKLGRTEK
jgi:hypothetical protein